jgi:hypothetical protein
MLKGSILVLKQEKGLSNPFNEIVHKERLDFRMLALRGIRQNSEVFCLNIILHS